MTFDTRAFRNALGNFPTGVCVITAYGDASHPPIGITVNSFTSVSLDPPMVLWCLDKKSDRYKIFTNAKHFTVNMLAADHQDISSRLAKQGEHKLDGVKLFDTRSGPPGIQEALSTFECETAAIHEGGDHAIIVGKVTDFHTHDSPPLVFFRGRYGALAG